MAKVKDETKQAVDAWVADVKAAQQRFKEAVTIADCKSVFDSYRIPLGWRTLGKLFVGQDVDKLIAKRREKDV